MTIAQIENSLDPFFAASTVKIVVPGYRHWDIFLKLLKETNAKADLVMDVHLAALAIENDAKLATTDKDFSVFRDLKHFNPLKS